MDAAALAARASRPAAGIEHFDGGYGWPEYEDRGQDNLAEPGTAPGSRPASG